MLFKKCQIFSNKLENFYEKLNKFLLSFELKISGYFFYRI